MKEREKNGSREGRDRGKQSSNGVDNSKEVVRDEGQELVGI